MSEPDVCIFYTESLQLAEPACSEIPAQLWGLQTLWLLLALNNKSPFLAAAPPAPLVQTRVYMSDTVVSPLPTLQKAVCSAGRAAGEL